MSRTPTELFNDLPFDIMKLVLDVARTSEIDPLEIMSRKRTNRVALARQVVMTVIRGRDYRFTLQQVGNFFGKDHGTVIHATKIIAERMRATDPQLAATLASAYRTYAAAREEMTSLDPKTLPGEDLSRESLDEFNARQARLAAERRALK